METGYCGDTRQSYEGCIEDGGVKAGGMMKLPAALEGRAGRCFFTAWLADAVEGEVTEVLTCCGVDSSSFGRAWRLWVT